MDFAQMKSGIKKCIRNPWRVFNYLADFHLLNWMQDEMYIRLLFRGSLGEKLHLDNPQTFNEKLQWLKLYDRQPQHTRLVDKYLVREYIRDAIGEEYLIPLLGVWDHPDEIDFDALPNRFVLKCNHNSGLGMCICKDKSKLDIEQVKKELAQGLAENYYLVRREWAYQDVPRKILCERYISDSGIDPQSGHDGLSDYKFFCFNGIVKFFKIDFDRFTDHHANYYSPEGELLPFGEADYPPKPDHQLPMPKNLKKMVELSEILSKGHKFLRVDFYEINGAVYFGELTLFPATGMGQFTPVEWDRIIGDWLVL